MNKELQIPNLGSNVSVDVVEILAKVGDRITIDSPLCVVESAKSSFDIVSLYNGTILKISLSLGQKIQSGEYFGLIQVDEVDERDENLASRSITSGNMLEKNPLAPITIPSPDIKSPASPAMLSIFEPLLTVLYASPLVRKLARTQKIALTPIIGSGPKGRITLRDLQSAILSEREKPTLPKPTLESLPDYELWGTISEQALSKIQKIAAQRFQHSWNTIPHVTHFDIASIDDLEAFRMNTNTEHSSEQDYIKLTLLSFIFKALAATLKEFPIFNSSLSSCGQKILFKDAIHLGCAVETSQGLLVPVVRNVDTLSIMEIKMALSILATKARSFQLLPQDYQGQTFTVSSLGSHGGRFFTPIIQWPDVAILGICKSYKEVTIAQGQLSHSLSLPLSLSYDHRVINGGQAARFMGALIAYLEDFKRITL
jgi:pyruvate dehydrogenase E2 component (dihydrolipoamide acetyltransferase)